MAGPLRALYCCLAFVALLNASCAYKSVPLTSTATRLRLTPTPLNLALAGAGNAHLRGTLYFAEGTFRFADANRLQVRMPAGTTAEYDIVLDLRASSADADEVLLQPDVKRASFRWNRDIEVTNDRRLSELAPEGPQAWLTVRAIQVDNDVRPAAPGQEVDSTLARSLALLISHVIADESGESLVRAKRIIRSVYLKESEIGALDEPAPGGEGQGLAAAAGSQGWLRNVSYVPWRPPVTAAPDDVAPAAEIGAAPGQVGASPASPFEPPSSPPPAGYSPYAWLPLTASAAVEDPSIKGLERARSSPDYLAGKSTRIKGIVTMALGGATIGGGIYALIWGSLRGFTLFGSNTLGPDRGAQVGGAVMMLTGAGAMGLGGALMLMGKREMKRVEKPFLPLAMPTNVEVHVGAGSLMLSGSF